MLPEDFKKWRQAKGWTQERTAEELHVRGNSIWRWENGHHRIPFFISYACRAIDNNLPLLDFEENNFKEWRLRIGLSKKQTAHLLGVTPRTVINWEKDLSASIPFIKALVCSSILYEKSKSEKII